MHCSGQWERVLFISNSTYVITVSFLIEAIGPHVLHKDVKRKKWEILDSLQTHDMDISSATYEPGWSLLTYLTILLPSSEACWCPSCRRNNSSKQQLSKQMCSGVCWIEVIWRAETRRSSDCISWFCLFSLSIKGMLNIVAFFYRWY